MLAPDNFPYFLALFSFAVLSGTYLLFTYFVSRLLILNAVVFFLAGVRVASEYYIQQIETFAEVEWYATWHILPANILIPLQWVLVWLYVRPLRGRRWERVANWAVVGLFTLPFFPHSYYCFIEPVIYYYHPERIDGYWQYAINADFWYYSIYRTHTDIMLLIVVITLAVGVIRDRENRLRQTFLFLSYLVMPVLYYSMAKQGEWNVPNAGILFLAHTFIISWYVSGYRLYGNNITLVTNDLLNSISDLTVSTDPNLQITGYNEKTTSLLALDTQDFAAWLSQNGRSEASGEEPDLRALIEGRDEEQTVVIDDLDGTARTFALKVSPFRSGTALLGYTFLLTDLTDLRAKETQLSEINATKDRLFAIIGHDLRRWALAFRGVGKKVDYLIAGDQTEQLRSFTNSLEKSAFALNSQLDNILNWALQQRGTLPYRPRQINLTDIVRETHDTFRDVAATKGVALDVTAPPTLDAYLDPNSLHTLLRNLVDNAIKFTPAGGSVHLRTSLHHKTVKLTVADTGIGMSEADRRQLFRLKEHRSRRGTDGEPGTGLGLILVGELVKLNRGTIAVESAPKVGTTITLLFPALAPATAPTERRERTLPPAPRTPA